jgi:hypothetical protein
MLLHMFGKFMILKDKVTRSCFYGLSYIENGRHQVVSAAALTWFITYFVVFKSYN